MCSAVDEAGGSGWPVDELCKMSVMGLISRLATNRVRFCFLNGGKKEKQK